MVESDDLRQQIAAKITTWARTSIHRPRIDPQHALAIAEALIAAGLVATPTPAEDAAYYVFSECAHPPVTLYDHEGFRRIQVGDYGVCWCDDDRERQVVWVSPAHGNAIAASVPAYREEETAP